jgi:hypothetical protein
MFKCQHIGLQTAQTTQHIDHKPIFSTKRTSLAAPSVRFGLRSRHVPQDEVNRMVKLASRQASSQLIYALDRNLVGANLATLQKGNGRSRRCPQAMTKGAAGKPRLYKEPTKKLRLWRRQAP